MPTVVFMGTPDFAASILQSLISSGYDVTAVFTQPDRPKGRRGLIQMPPVKELALKMGIPVYQPQKIRLPENVQLLKTLHPDYIVVAAFGQIIPQEILDIPPYGCLNVHASLLPAWRGAAPIQWSILSGDRVTGVTIMRMNAGLDTGDMILKAEVPIGEDETGDSLFDKLMEEGARILPQAMEQIRSGSAVYTPQPQESPTPYAKMLTRQSGLVDWSRSAAQIARMVRAFDSWPGAWTILNGKTLKILRACEVPAEEAIKNRPAAASPEEGSAKQDGQAALSSLAMSQGQPGEIVSAGKDGLVVRTGSGLLRLLEVQPEGKKRMEADAFLRGYRLQPGEVFRSDR